MYETENKTAAYSGSLTQNAENKISSNPTGSREFSIRGTDWIGQFFTPNLPQADTNWAVKRALFKARLHDPAIGQTKVQLRRADGNNLPTGSIIEEQILSESVLTDSIEWQEFHFSDAADLTSGDRIFLVLEWVSDDHSAKVEYGDSGSGRVTTTDGGGERGAMTMQTPWTTTSIGLRK